MTGGSSPLGLYRLLAEEPLRSEVPWARVHWFIGDDRFVPESDPLSNMGAHFSIGFRRRRKTSTRFRSRQTIPATPRIVTKMN